MNIKLWEDFENISESRLFYSPNFKRILQEIGTGEARHLLDLEGDDFAGDITLLDINSEGQITYNTERNFQKSWPELWDLYFNQPKPPIRNNRISDIAPEVFKDPNRGVISIGKLMNKIYPEIGVHEFQHLINCIKSRCKESQYEIKVVEGDEISKWYKLENCQGESSPWNENKSVLGTLGNSCMMNKSDKLPGILDIYTKNPEVCKLVIMLNPDGELVARAILWKATTWEEGFLKEVFLQDRVYYIQDWMGTNLVNWAKKQGYYYRGFYTGSEIYKDGRAVDKNFKVKIKKIRYKRFPYLDTFSYYNVGKAELTNFKTKSGFLLSSTSGGFSDVGIGGFPSNIRNRGINWIRRFNEYNSEDFS
jgi:hypothetical protein